MQPLLQQSLANQDIFTGGGSPLPRSCAHRFHFFYYLEHAILLRHLQHPIMHGIWVTQTKTKGELGIGLPDLVLTNQTWASEIGQVPRDGGDFLKL